MLRLANPVRHYAWGSTDALPALLGVPPDGRPHAEIWVGAHPAAPSFAVGAHGGGDAHDAAGHRAPVGVPLDVLVRERPADLLGHRTRARFGDRLPYLVKLLAADRPLSLQVHPDAERARRRHAQEVAAGVADVDRRYPDPWHKPELLVALRPTLALAGLRDPDDAADLLTALPAPGPTAVAGVVAALRAPGPAPDRLRGALRRVLGLPPGAVAVVTTALAVASASGADLDLDPDPYRVAARLAAHAPGDPGVVASLLMHPVLLAPGEALAVAAGVLHCYVAGTGLEVMAASDNVLRAGLTDKLVDPEELLAAVAADPVPPVVLRPRAVPRGPGLAVRSYAAGVPEAELVVVDVDAEEPVALADGVGRDGPRTLLALSGVVEVGTRAGRRGLGVGESVLVTHAEGAVTLAGRGSVALVAVPVGPGPAASSGRPAVPGGAA